MYFSADQLAKDLIEDKIDRKDVFFYLSRMPRKEREKFIKKAKGLILVKG